METRKNFVLLLTIISLSIFFSCNQLDFNKNFAGYEGKEQPTVSDPKFNVSFSSAQCLVNILNKDKEDSLKKEVLKIEPIAYQKDTLLYIVNYQDNKGWMVISGDKRTLSILACSDKGTFELNKTNPGVAIWTDDLAEQIYALKHRETIATDTLSENYNVWEKIDEYMEYIQPQSRLRSSEVNGSWQLYNITSQVISNDITGPLLTTKWGQGYPWNTCVPTISINSTVGCPTGCVAVAATQVLYYLHYKLGIPASMYSTGQCTGWYGSNYQFEFSNATTTTWDQMARKWTDPGTINVAVLMGYTGWQIGMNYSESGSGTPTQNLVAFFSNQGIQCTYTENYDASSILSSLDNNMPVIMQAYATRIDNTFLGIHQSYSYADGHDWVIDGYKKQKEKFIYYYQWVGSTPVVDDTMTEESIITTNFLLMNWGWDSQYDDGLYSIDDGAIWNSNGYNFQWNKAMLLNFAKK